jgi:hypothetical protein
MDVKKIVFLGDSHVQGVGAEWPKLYGNISATPKEFTRNIWNNYIRTTSDSPEQIFKKYKEVITKVKFDFTSNPAVQKYRDEYSWAKVFTKYYNKEYVNYGFGAYNLTHIVSKLILDNSTFEDSLVILGVPSLKNDLTFHNPYNTKQFQNITIVNAAKNILLIKEFVERRGGRFVYLHIEDYPFEFYDIKNNPHLYHLQNIKLFERSLYSFFTPNFEKKKHDGIHYNLDGHKFIGNVFAKEFQNTLIYSLL